MYGNTVTAPRLIEEPQPAKPPPDRPATPTTRSLRPRDSPTTPDRRPRRPPATGGRRPPVAATPATADRTRRPSRPAAPLVIAGHLVTASRHPSGPQPFGR